MPYVSFWVERIHSDAKFKDDVKCRWQRLRAVLLKSEVIDAQLDAWATSLKAKAVSRHYGKWPDLKKSQWPNPCDENRNRQSAFPTLLAPNCMSSTTGNVEYFEHQVSWLKSWVKHRIEWLDRSLPGTCRM